MEQIYGKHWAPLSNVLMPLSCLFTWDLYLLLESTRQATKLVGPLPVSVKVMSRPPASNNPLSPTLLHASLVVAQLPRPPIPYPQLNSRQTDMTNCFSTFWKSCFCYRGSTYLPCLREFYAHWKSCPTCLQSSLVTTMMSGHSIHRSVFSKTFFSTNPQTPVTFNH